LLLAMAWFAPSASPAAQKTVWLCFPGKASNPCTADLATTVIRADGSKAVESSKPAASPPIDCFYVYPTVSDEPTGNSDLVIGLPQILVAETQASQFSPVCRVYAPMYRQITSSGLANPSLHASLSLAYDGVRDAWRDYLAHYNKGRGVVLIGHSQGAYVLKHLLATEVDPSRGQRRLLVSAILLGGQVHAGKGGDVGHVPACGSPSATGCLIAYSSFDSMPAPGARFGRSNLPGSPIVCVNPAVPGSKATEPVTPLFPTNLVTLAGSSVEATTPWVAFPGLYTARCERSGNASWLQITRTNIPGDTRPAVHATLGAGWGLHLVDVNIALTNLVDVVKTESQAFARAR
jgi:hypothetical protein